MSELANLMNGALNNDAVAKIAQQLGIDPVNAERAVSAALPSLVTRLHTNATASAAEADALAATVNADHDGTVLDDTSTVLTTAHADAVGSSIVTQTFGDDATAAHVQVAEAAGIEPSQAAGVMAMLAPMVLGALGRSGSANGGLTATGLTGLLSGFLQHNSGSASSTVNGTSDTSTGPIDPNSIVGKVGSLVDRNHDGSVVDDVTRFAESGVARSILGFFKRR